MTWILTYSGIEFNLIDPTAEMVNLDDIAVSLSNIKRFNGHTNVNCSVALHSVILSHAVPKYLAKTALLHDAHEAYIGDITTPVKTILKANLIMLVQRIDNAISIQLGVCLKADGLMNHYDLRHLRYEKENFLPDSSPWPCLEGIKKLNVPAALSRFYGIQSSYAHQQLFLDRCKELGVNT